MRFIAFISLLLCAASIARAQDASFVVNKDAKIASLSADDAKNILLGNKVKFDDGTNITLVVLTDGPVHEKIVRDYTQRSTDQFEKFWKKQVFTGKGTMPTQCKSDADVIEFVSKTPGALGYVAKASVTAAVAAVEVK